jgi:hypothetical protein
MACPHRYAKRCGREYWSVGLFRARAPDSAQSFETHGGYVGQDFGELSRVAVLECNRPAANSGREVNVRFCSDYAGSVGGPVSPPSAITILVVAHATTHR